MQINKIGSKSKKKETADKFRNAAIMCYLSAFIFLVVPQQGKKYIWYNPKPALTYKCLSF